VRADVAGAAGEEDRRHLAHTLQREW
jgi:hypothetical protein